MAALASTALGDPPAVRLWTWNPPVGAAAQADDRLTAVVKCDTRLVPPAQAANQAVIEIYDRGLTTDEICIVPGYLGMGDGVLGQPWQAAPALFRHWCDALPDTANPATASGQCLAKENAVELAEYWWGTPWTGAGVSETRGWMEAFIGQYEFLQIGAPWIPDPARFHFDTEDRLSGTSLTWQAAFVALVSDERWNTEGILGCPDPNGAPGDLLTMADLWAARPAGVEMPDGPAAGWWDPARQPWTNWYMALCNTTSEAAMASAAYDLVHDAWPDAKCSNFDVSLRIDADHRYRPLSHYGGYFGADIWCDLRWWGLGDLQAAALYPVSWNHTPPEDRPLDDPATPGIDESLPENWPDEVYWRTTLDVQRENIDALIGSLDPGDDPSEITPWIMNVGEIGDVIPGVRSITIDGTHVREMLTTLRSRKIHEIGVWDAGVTEADWNVLATVVDQVWRYRIDGYQVVAGTVPSPTRRLDRALPALPPVGTLEFALDDFLTLEPSFRTADPLGWVVTVDTTFQNGDAAALDPPDDAFEVTVEATLPLSSLAENVRLSVSLRDFANDEWDPIGSVFLSRGEKTVLIAESAIGGDHRSAAGQVVVRLECFNLTLPYEVAIDSVTLVDEAN